MARRPSPARSPPPREASHKPAPEVRHQAMHEASRAVIELFLRRRTSDFSVKELAEHTGLSERTFYRYFPRKEDAIRPYVDAWLAKIVADVRASPPHRPLREALVSAHAQAFRAGREANWEALLPVLNETESLRAVWLQVVTDAEAAFAQVVAERLGLSATSLQARMAGAVLVTAGRLALERSLNPKEKRDPAVVFADCLAILGPALFERPAAAGRPRTKNKGSAAPRR